MNIQKPQLHVEATCPTCRVSSPHKSYAPPRRDRRGQNTCLCIPHAYVCRSALSREQWRLALSKLEKLCYERTRTIGPAWAVSYSTDQPMTRYSTYFSGGSTINGTPGTDPRVLGGQIGRLSLPLHRVDTECYGSTKLKMNPALPKTHNEIHSSPETATNSRRCAAKHVPRVSPCSPASIDPGFVEIGPMQLSQPVKTTNVTHTLTQRRTDGQTH